MMRWVKIKGYDNYSISEYGDIRNDKTGRVLKQHQDANGYLSVCLYNNGKQKRLLVHRLVLTAFTEQSDLQVNHIDENKHNNKLTNLEWCTQRENNVHGTRLARIAKKQYKKVDCFDLNNNFIKTFDALVLAEKETGVKHGNISNCCNGKYKRAGKFIWKYTNNKMNENVN